MAETLFMLYKQNRQIYFHLPDANDAVHVSLPENHYRLLRHFSLLNRLMPSIYPLYF
ncbi:MAG: hypothetical protein HWD59_02600 [Coxiellaceae bacterium]|nr:MAG: hypothetical protein HWD59_02600 [Coxiellaceae bacterium]